MLEQAVVAHGAPTLARLKPGSLFNLACDSDGTLREEMARLSPALRDGGVELTVLRRRERWHLMYLYRPAELAQALGHPEVRDFMARYGYGKEPEAALERLCERRRADGRFPHEIGVFLGYPLRDVQGFILNEGRDCLLSGLWKVYADPERAQALFAQYRRCTEAYVRLFAQGWPLSRLTARAAGPGAKTEAGLTNS